LYETVLFITAVAVVTALSMEWVNRQRVALALGSALGVLGVFLANKYEIREGADTMPSMAAVLDTNFWLATHVTTISMGYAAGLLAGALAHVYLLGKLFGVKREEPRFYTGLSRMVYGALCFSLFFSVLGTVLGGIWANESWGRFWGWDPKENGALMIVLWQLTILHARMGGIVRDFGVNLAAVAGAVIVAFSWFGVNLLGVGLHSYGFTSGIYRALLAFYVIETVVLMLGCLAWGRESVQEAAMQNHGISGTGKVEKT
jgi:ABC-type transport system involved in cytochrome c biogenesis permease subunit